MFETIDLQLSRMNVLSLFDGISCGQIALKNSNFSVDNYFSSEIDKNAIKVTQYNFPNTIQLGDVKNWRNWNLDFSKIDILLAGHPCQSFSLSGKKNGFLDSRGSLVHFLYEIFNEIKQKNPNFYFLFENVKMKADHQKILDELWGFSPIKINSSLVSSQNRERLYWTNIPNIKPPKDLDILLKDVIDNYWSDGHFSDGFHFTFTESKLENLKHYIGEFPSSLKSSWRSNPYSLLKIEENIKKLLVSSKYYDNFQWKFDKIGRILVLRPDGLKIQRIGRISSIDNKTEILTCVTQPHINDGHFLRKITCSEAEKLQTLPKNYTNIGLSDNQRFKMIGNGWTVDVISHILSHLK